MPDPRPRIILEQQTDGTLVMETYTNGQRERTELMHGQELSEMLDALARKQRELDASAERKRRLTILPVERLAGSPIPAGYEQAHFGDTIATLQRVCHCGTKLPLAPMQERCADCPGFTGGGFVKKLDLLTPEELEKKERKRHNLIWKITAQAHGKGFADRTIGRQSSAGRAKPSGTIIEQEDLL